MITMRLFRFLRNLWASAVKSIRDNLWIIGLVLGIAASVSFAGLVVFYLIGLATSFVLSLFGTTDIGTDYIELGVTVVSMFALAAIIAYLFVVDVVKWAVNIWKES